jgi:hypothetical protein
MFSRPLRPVDPPRFGRTHSDRHRVVGIGGVVRHFRAVVVRGEDVERRRILPEQPVRHHIVEDQVVRTHDVERSGHRLALARSASLGHRLFDTIDSRFVGAGADGDVGPELGERLAPPFSPGTTSASLPDGDTL